MYEFISNDHEISLKAGATDHVNGVVIDKYAPGTVFRGDFLHQYPVDLEFARIGDVWLHVTEVSGVEVDGWVGVVHQGVKYGDIVEVSVNPTPAWFDVITGKIGDEQRDYIPRA